MRSLVPQGAFERAMRTLFPPPDFLLMPAAGVDISNSAIKVLAMRHGNIEKGIRVFDTALLAPNIIENGDVLDKGALVKTLSTLREKNRLSFVHVALPEKRAFIFQTKVSRAISRAEAKTVLESKLEEHVPLSPQEALFDFEYVEGVVQGEEVLVNVSVYARRVVEGYLGAFVESGLQVLSCEVESQAIARAVIERGDENTYLIIDFGRTSTKLAIASRGVIMYSSTVEIGGHAITQAIMKHLNVSQEEADVIKNEQGFYQRADDKGLSEAMMSTVSALTDEINKRFLYWKDRKEHDDEYAPPIDKIIMCGGNANLRGFSDFLFHSLGVPVELANIWANVPGVFEHEVPVIPRAHSFEYATALGLALRGHLP